MKFSVQTTENEQIAYVADEVGRVRIQLTKPADFQHAWRVVEFLNQNVHAVSVDGAGEAKPAETDAYAGR
jgi:hypothetical protein